MSGATSAEVLHGRAAERRRLSRLLAAARAGEAEAVVLVGDAGIGKSALADELAAEAERDGATVLRSRAVPGEEHVPFAALGQLLGAVADDLEAVEEPGRAALAVALGRTAGAPPTPPAVAIGLVELFAVLAGDEGLLIVADDAQWMDEETLRALAFALRRMPGERVAGVLAARPDPDRGLLRLGFEAIALGPLEADAAARMAADVTGATAGPALERALELAAGNPLAIRELTAASRDGGPGEGSRYAPAAPSLLVEREFGRLLEGLTPAARDALLVLAAEEDPRAPLVGERLGLEPAAFEEAEAAGVVVPEGGGRRFRHPLLRGVAYHGAPLARRQEVHRAWADLDGLDPIRRAWHAAATVPGPDEAVAARLEEAGETARARGGVGSAAEAMARAGELSPDPAEGARRLLEAARFASRGGWPRASVAHAEAGLALPVEDGMVRAELAGLRASQLLRLGDVEGPRVTLIAVAEAAAGQAPARAAVAFLTACADDRVAGDLEAMRLHAARAAELSEGSHPTIHAIARGNVAVAELALGSGGEPAVATLAATEPALVGDGADRRTGDYLTTAAHAAVWIGRHEMAERVLEHRIARMRELGEVGELPYPLSVRAELALRRGRLAAAFADASEALEIAEGAGMASPAAAAASVLAAVEALLGRDEDCLAHAETALAPAEGRTALALSARVALGLLFLGRNQPERALPRLRGVAEATRRIGVREPTVLAAGADLVEALVRTGEPAEARRALTEQLEGSGLDTAWRRGAIARGRAFLASGEEAAALFEESAAEFDAGGLRVEAARSRLYLGERLRRDRRRRLARRPLGEALEVFERMGARPWAERARDELRASGQEGTQDRGGFADGLDELTPHELRVALAVAGGRSNPEVAAELYVTRKTVEYHLTRVFRKLGVASRAELVRLLADRVPSGGASPAA